MEEREGGRKRRRLRERKRKRQQEMEERARKGERGGKKERETEREKSRDREGTVFPSIFKHQHAMETRRNVLTTVTRASLMQGTEQVSKITPSTAPLRR